MNKKEGDLNNLNKLAQDVAVWRKSKGFYTPEKLDDSMLGKLMLVVTELAEAAEAVRKNDPDNFVEEIADTFIRLMDITGTMKIDIEKAIARKMEINAGRPFRHNKKINL